MRQNAPSIHAARSGSRLVERARTEAAIAAFSALAERSHFFVGAGEEACRVNLFGRPRQRNSSERLPWYWASDYSGNLTEAEKRELDGFRMQADHPAYQYELPEHVELCITGLQLDAYDLKQERAAVRAFTITLVGAAVLYIAHFGAGPSNSIWSYLIGIGLMIVPWVIYRSE